MECRGAVLLLESSKDGWIEDNDWNKLPALTDGQIQNGDDDLKGYKHLAYMCKKHMLKAELIFSPPHADKINDVQLSTVLNELHNGCLLIIRALAKGSADINSISSS